MSKKLKIGLLVIVIFALIGVGALYYIKKQNKNEPACETESSTCPVSLSSVTSPEATTTQIGSFASPQAVELKRYTSDKLGFELTFSDVWQSAKVLETIPAGSAEGKVEFQLPTKDKAFETGLVTALTIYVYKSNSVPTSEENPLLTKITDNGSLYYGFTGWKNAPSDLGQITEKEIAREAATLKLKN